MTLRLLPVFALSLFVGCATTTPAATTGTSTGAVNAPAKGEHCEMHKKEGKGCDCAKHGEGEAKGECCKKHGEGNGCDCGKKGGEPKAEGCGCGSAAGCGGKCEQGKGCGCGGGARTSECGGHAEGGCGCGGAVKGAR